MYPPLALPEQLSESSLRRRRARAEADARQFIRGPVYLDPLLIAAKLPGKALQLWLLILYRGGVEGGSPAIEIRPGVLKRFGIGRQSAYRALEALEHAGLITADRHRGRSAVVTIKAAKRREHAQ